MLLTQLLTSPGLSLAFGIFWGMMIFNLDRYIVSSTGKGDGTSKITFSEWKNAFPRLLMALLLGFVIATPLELRLFEKEINMEIETLKQQKRAESRNQVEVNYTEIGELELKVLSLNAESKEKAAVRDGKYQSMIEEAEGLSGSGRPGAGKIYKDKKMQYEKMEREYQELKAENDKKIQKLEERIDALKESRNEEVSNIENVSAQYDGLMAKLEAFGKLTDTYPTLKAAKWLITAMFIFIEIAPILFKMMTETGPYDEMVERTKEVSKIQEKEAIALARETSALNMKLALQQNRSTLDATVHTEKYLKMETNKNQTEIAIAAIENWKEIEKSKSAATYEAIVNS